MVEATTGVEEPQPKPANSAEENKTIQVAQGDEGLASTKTLNE